MSSTCTEVTRASSEPIAGTAPVALGWILVERAGAWGRNALTGSTLDPAVGAALAAATEPLPVRAVLIRRPGRHAATAAPTSVVLAHTGPHPWAERLALGSDRDLLDLDPAVCTATAPPGLGEPVVGPLFLVCTHAKRDRCCATLGRPLVDTLAALHTAETWEVSHIGGHRFAGNLLVLPDGLAYGGLDVASGLSVVAEHLAGRLGLEHLRGRTMLSRPAQAAEIAVRRRLGIDTVDGVHVHDVEVADPSDGTNHYAVTVDAGDVRLRVAVTREAIGERLVSCDAAVPEDPHTFRVTAIAPIDAGDA